MNAGVAILADSGPGR